eukprot:scaffold1213_cov256-Pinguiococcus_pyrenoidosus.AAC.5
MRAGRLVRALWCPGAPGQAREAVRSTRRSFHFASPEYVQAMRSLPEVCRQPADSCECILLTARLLGMPQVDSEKLRQDALSYMEVEAQSRRWFDDPVCTLLNGVGLCDGQTVATRDGFGVENGSQLLATPEEVDAVVAHLQSLAVDSPPDPDVGAKVRRIEDQLLSTYAGALIGNQALDFGKQDGVTEMAEAVQANVVERRLNDALLEAEKRGEVRIPRGVAFVGCVSNFGNFLDLFRKTIRNLEASVPVVVLSRSNTTQHNFRWAQILVHEMREKQVDARMLTFLSAGIDDQCRVMDALAATSPMYLTGSRAIAEKVKMRMPMTFSSTGGPNTMVAPDVTGEVAEAARVSTAIENSGQCTALRHLVTDRMDEAEMGNVFSSLQEVASPQDALARDVFDGVFPAWAASFTPEPGYKALKDKPVAYRIAEGLPAAVTENWRRLYLDVTTPGGGGVRHIDNLRKLSRWLVREQPITLAVNGDDDHFAMSKFLFEHTAQVVNSIGRDGAPALTCQARPQEGEIFGEFPPRMTMEKYTVFPVVVPSATPGYMAAYRVEHLADAASGASAFGSTLRTLLDTIDDQAMKGYGVLLLRYLRESCGAKEDIGARTTLWGLQRPPDFDVHTIFR